MRKLRRNKEPEYKLLKKLSILKPDVIHTKAGFPMYLLPIQDQEIVKIDFVFNAGDYYASQVLASLSTLSMLQEGSQTQTAEAIAERLDFLGSYLSCSTTKDKAVVSLCSLEKHLAESVKIVTDCILHPSFPEDKFATHLSKRKERYKIDIERVEVLSQKKLAQVLFGSEHPYGRSCVLDDFSSITRDDLVQFHSDNYVAENLKIVLCGNLKSNEVKNIIHYLAELPIKTLGKQVNRKEYQIVSDTEHKHFIPKENAVQSSINIGKIMVNRTHKDYVPLQVLNTVLGGYFGSRLMSTVREEKGYTYGIGSGIISYENSGYFIITTRVGKEVVQPALDAIYHEIKRLRTETIPDDELNMVKTYMLSTIVRNFDGALATSEMLRNTFDYNIDYHTYYQQFWRRVKKVQSKELQQLANDYFNENSMYEIVVG
ncbi:MAG: insulinase family protein [Bacteroidales bacterium]|nr:insulinase family protein [Bacteroidales bacterium]